MKEVKFSQLKNVTGGKGSASAECKSKETKNKDGSTTKETSCKAGVKWG